MTGTTTIEKPAASRNVPAAIAKIEHVNLSVSDPQASADLLSRLFGWQIRWQGPAAMGGWTVHVGSKHAYIALYGRTASGDAPRAFAKGVPFNHVGIEVDDLDAVEARVIEAGLKPFSHGNYEPGRRFYFFDRDGIEYEIVSYAP